MLKKFLLAGAGLFVVAILLIAFFLWRHSLAGGDPAFYESEILAFEQSDTIAMPEPGAIVFTGSSSIRLWATLAADMAPLRVVQRGFGGAHMEHVVYNVPRVVTKYSPRAVVVFVGGNDLGAGKTVAEVVADFEQFLQEVHTRLPATDVWFLSMKPSPLRWEKWAEMQQVDAALEAMAAADPRVFFVATGRRLLGEDGSPGDFYIFDGLHLNQSGYDRWTEVLRPRLLEAYPVEGLRQPQARGVAAD